MMRVFGCVLLLGIATGACARGPGIDESIAPSERAELTDARFNLDGRNWGSHRLELAAFDVDVRVLGPLAKTRIGLAIHNPSPYRSEARIRLPVPPGAAVVRAVLEVGDRPMQAAFVERKRAAQIYESIVKRRRDPLLVSWAGPEALSLSVFPLEAGQTRRLDLDWIEPIATLDGEGWYRVPVIGDQGKLVGLPDRIRVDGRRVDGAEQAWLGLGRVPAAAWKADEYRIIVRNQSLQAQTDGLVLMLETSQALSGWARNRQVETARAILTALPAHTRVNLLAVDWLVQAVAEDVTVDEAKMVLERWSDIPLAGALHPQRVLAIASEIAERVNARALIFVGQGRDAFAAEGNAEAGAPLAQARQTLSAVTEAPSVTAQWSPFARHVDAHRGATMIAKQVCRSFAELGAPVPGGREGEEVMSLPTVTGAPVMLARAPSRPTHGPGSDLRGAFAAVWARACIEQRAQGCGGPPIISPRTSLLALENERQYATWGIGSGIAGLSPQSSPNDMPPTLATQSVFGLYGRRNAAVLATARIVRMPRAVRELSHEREAYAYARARLLRTDRQALLSCLAQDGSAAARGRLEVDVLLRVSATGDVVGIRIDGVSEHSAEGVCLGSLLRRWSFPSIAKGETFVRLALRLPPEEGSPVSNNGEDLLTQAVRLDDHVGTLPVVAAKVYDFPYWANVEHLAWLLANSSERRVSGFDENRPWISSWLTLLLAAKLLRAAGAELDAQRVLSEIAPQCPALATRTLESWGLRDDVASIPTSTRRHWFYSRPGYDPFRGCAELTDLLY